MEGFTFNTRSIVIITLVVMAVVIVYFMIMQKQLSDQIQKLQAEKAEAEAGYLKLLEDYMNKTKSIPESARIKLEELKNTYARINPDIEAELITVLDLLDGGKEAIAVEKLTKIVENVLKERLNVEAAGGKNDKRKTFMEMIREAIKMNVICERLGAFMNALRVMRNEEAHELNVQLDQNETLIYLLTSVHVLFELAGTKQSEYSFVR